MRSTVSTTKRAPVAVLRGLSKRSIWREMVHERQLYLLLLPTLIYFGIFHFGPLFGLQIAFKDYLPTRGIIGSEWVGLKHFLRFVNGPYFLEIVRNTVVLNAYSIIVNTPLPVILALLLMYQKNLVFRKIVQNLSYVPHFVSVVVVVGMLKLFTSPINGMFNKIIEGLGGVPVHFMAEPQYFYHLFVWSGIWQLLGWMAIIYIGALTSINPEQHQAAIVDGATIFQRIRHIDLPGIMPTFVILLILRTGNLLNIGFEKVYLMQNVLNSSVSEVIATYTYKTGLLSAQYSFATAVGLLNALANFAILVSLNAVARRVSEHSLF